MTSWCLGVGNEITVKKTSNPCKAIAGQNKTNTLPPQHARDKKRTSNTYMFFWLHYVIVIMLFFATILMNLCQPSQQTTTYNNNNYNSKNKYQATNKHTNKQTNKRTNNQTNQQTNKQASKQANKQTSKHTNNSNSNSSKLRSLQSKDLRASHRQRLLLKLRNVQFRCGVRKSASSPERRLQEGLQRLVEDNSIGSLVEAGGFWGCVNLKNTQWYRSEFKNNHWLNTFQLFESFP